MERSSPTKLIQIKLRLRPALPHPQRGRESRDNAKGKGVLNFCHPLSGLASGISGLGARAESFSAEAEAEHTEHGLESKSQKLPKEEQRLLNEGG